jgi:hypothetical protein
MRRRERRFAGWGGMWSQGALELNDVANADQPALIQQPRIGLRKVCKLRR